MVVDRKSVAIIDLSNMIKRQEATQILAYKGFGWYVCACEHPVAPSGLLDHDFGVGHVLEVNLGEVNTFLPGALV